VTEMIFWRSNCKTL